MNKDQRHKRREIDQVRHFGRCGRQGERFEPQNKCYPHLEESDIDRTHQPLPWNDMQTACQQNRDKNVEEPEKEIQEEFDHRFPAVFQIKDPEQRPDQRTPDSKDDSRQAGEAEPQDVSMCGDDEYPGKTYEYSYETHEPYLLL